MGTVWRQAVITAGGFWGGNVGPVRPPARNRLTAKMDNRYPDVLVGGGAAPAPDVGAGVQPY